LEGVENHARWQSVRGRFIDGEEDWSSDRPGHLGLGWCLFEKQSRVDAELGWLAGTLKKKECVFRRVIAEGRRALVFRGCVNNI